MANKLQLMIKVKTISVHHGKQTAIDDQSKNIFSHHGKQTTVDQSKNVFSV